MSDDAILSEKEKWEKETLDKVIKKRPERRDRFELTSGIEVERLYTPGDMDYISELGFPGSFPYTRGVQPTMYRGRLWTMRQYAGFGTADDTNKRYRYLLEQGQTGLSVAFDLPTQMGYDSDHPMSLGEVGRVGVVIDTLEDMERLFDSIPLGKVSTSMTINSTAAVLLAMYVAVAKKQGVEAKDLRGTVQNDVLKEYVARGTYIYPPKHSMRLITDIFGYCSGEVPRWNAISVSGYHMREAGCTAVQEVAFTLADAVEYVRAAIDAGLGVDDFGPNLSFFFCVHNNFLEEVAKFRAARRMWARIMKDEFGSANPRSRMLRFHTQTAGCSLTAQQPDVNVVRVTIQALAAVLGGTQSLHTNSRDEALALPTEEAVTIALRTQQVIGYESGVAETIDPLGGSYAIEELTDRIEEEAAALMKQVADLGGMVKAIEHGFVQREIQKASYQYQLEVEKKERVVVGVNDFVSGEDVEVPILRIDPEVERSQRERLDKVKEGRDAAEVERTLGRLEDAAKSTDDNLVEPIIDAVRAYATIGEISDTLRKVFGEYKEQVVV